MEKLCQLLALGRTWFVDPHRKPRTNDIFIWCIQKTPPYIYNYWLWTLIVCQAFHTKLPLLFRFEHAKRLPMNQSHNNSLVKNWWDADRLKCIVYNALIYALCSNVMYMLWHTTGIKYMQQTLIKCFKATRTL